MLSYSVMVTLALPGAIMTNKNIEDINEAISHANINLASHQTHLGKAERNDEYTATFELQTSNCKIIMRCNDFRIGNRLNGISKYLLKKYPEKYERLKYGSRLLYYDVC